MSPASPRSNGLGPGTLQLFMLNGVWLQRDPCGSTAPPAGPLPSFVWPSRNSARCDPSRASPAPRGGGGGKGIVQVKLQDRRIPDGFRRIPDDGSGVEPEQRPFWQGVPIGSRRIWWASIAC